MSPPAQTGVAALTPDGAEEAARLAAQLGLPVVELQEPHDDLDFVLTVTPEGLELREGEAPLTKGVRVDFRSVDVRRGSPNLSKKQPLPRALGRDTRRVVDATAGLGHDAFLLAAMGYEVTAVERSPIVAALLEDGVRRAREEPALREAIDDRLEVINADAFAYLRTLKEPPDAIYLDPMFPPRRKASAIARKSIRVVRALVGEDPDAAQLLQAALASGARRVVLKRPDEAPESLGKPALTFPGRLVRYEVFFPAASPGVGSCQES
jgi:16S rRNA (guanine1516-N2)-methyltransferase